MQSSPIKFIYYESKKQPELVKKASYQTDSFDKWYLDALTATKTNINRRFAENKHLYNPPMLYGCDSYFVKESKSPTFDPTLKSPENNE